MKEYLRILREVLKDGVAKQPVRFKDNGEPVVLDTGTIGIFAPVFTHDMSEGFPLLTTKKMPLRTIAVELEGFIKGITSKKWYQERKCKVWNEWANPLAVKRKIFPNEPSFLYDSITVDKELQKKTMLEVDDLGPIYGYQWRRFGEAYDEDDGGPLEGYDQFKTVCDRLRENPYDRRMVVSGWNPHHLSRAALPCCHFAWNVVVYGNKLNLIWHQRSVDGAIGLPFNIASYAILLLLLAQHSGLEPGVLKGTLNDCHVYNDQIEQVKIQLERQPRKIPTVNIQSTDIFEWSHEDLELVGYNPHPKIPMSLTIH